MDVPVSLEFCDKQKGFFILIWKGIEKGDLPCCLRSLEGFDGKACEK